MQRAFVFFFPFFFFLLPENVALKREMLPQCSKRERERERERERSTTMLLSPFKIEQKCDYWRALSNLLSDRDVADCTCFCTTALDNPQRYYPAGSGKAGRLCELERDP